MAKSNYPDKLDTSVEIPAVRDNIVEVGSDVINSIRTAIFQIERTLGINPQGVAGNTVASRIGKSLDSNGNILKEALDSAGLLSGPISDKDVSKTAAIKESKLNLNYPTNLLQDEISQLSSALELIEAAVNDLSATLAVHINPLATDRHSGIAISIGAISNTGSSDGITSLDSTTSQGAFESIFSSHINYDGTNISEENRSHLSSQVFFDNNNVSAYIQANDAQGAIEDAVGAIIGQADVHQNLFHSNSIERTSVLYGQPDITRGTNLISNQSISYSASLASSDSGISRIFFSTPPEVGELSIGISDILSITNGEETTDYQIFRVNYSLDNLTIESVDIYALFSADSPSGIIGSIYRNKNRETDSSGLLIGIREYDSLDGTSYTNADIIQISNPSATSIVTSNIKPQEISSTNRYILISVDGGADIQLDLYDEQLALSGESQNINSIAKRLNEQFASNRLSVSAYRLDYDDIRGSEVAIVHAIGNSPVSEHTIKISRGTDDSIDSVGFSNIEDKTIVGSVGTNFYIQGASSNNLLVLLDETGFALTSGTSEIFTGNTNPLELGIKKGDILTIYGSPSDDGTYVITSISSNRIIVNRGQLPGNVWASSADTSTRFIVYSGSVSLNSIAFKATIGGSSLLSVLEIFLDKNKILNYNELLTYQSETYLGSENIISPCNFSGDISVYTESDPGSILVQKASSDPSDNEILLSLDGGDEVSIKNIKNDYITLYSGRYNLSLVIFIHDSDLLNSKIVSDGTSFEVSLFGYKSVNKEENLILGKVLYEAGVSRISGFGKDYPRPFRDLRFGPTGVSDLGSDVRKEFLIQPHLEKRSNGVIHGLEVYGVIDNGDTYTLSITSGTCYVRGKRFDLNENVNYITDVVTAGSPPSVDKFYVAVDEYGKIVFSPADPSGCGCTLDPSLYCILASVENNLVTINSIDLRLFIDDLDLKILNSITVSPQPGMAHFTEVPKAIRYAKRFSELFPSAGVPTIHLKSGTHRVVVDHGINTGDITTSVVNQKRYDQGLWLNFPVNITGEGDSTVLDMIYAYNDFPESNDTRIDGSGFMLGEMTITGPGFTSTPNGTSETITSGYVNLSDFKVRLGKIKILDPAVSDTSPINFGVNINNVIFDFSERESFRYESAGVVVQRNDMGSTDPTGNLNINNCIFINSNLSLIAIDVEYFYNSNISNNIFKGQETPPTEGVTNYGIYCSGASGHIFDFADCPSENNVNIIGNIIGDNFIANGDVGAPTIDPAGTHPWGDRFSRAVNVGDDLNVGDNLDVDGSLVVTGNTSTGGALIVTGNTAIGGGLTVIGSTTSEEYLYGSAREVKSFFWADELYQANPSYGFPFWRAGATSMSYGISELNISGTSNNAYYPIIQQGGLGPFRLKIPRLPNGTLKFLTLGINETLDNVEVKFYRISSTPSLPNDPLELLGTDDSELSILIGSPIRRLNFSFDPDITLSHLPGYIIQIQNTVSSTLNLFYIEFTVEVNSVDQVIKAEVP